jgi:hypothetical protein
MTYRATMYLNDEGDLITSEDSTGGKVESYSQISRGEIAKIREFLQAGNIPKYDNRGVWLLPWKIIAEVTREEVAFIMGLNLETEV